MSELVAGMKSADLAAEAGVSRWTWRRWESGHPVSRLARPVALRAIKRLRALAIKRGVPADQVPDLVIGDDGRIQVRGGI